MLDIPEYGLTYFWKVNRGKHGQENCEGTSGMGGWKNRAARTSLF